MKEANNTTTYSIVKRLIPFIKPHRLSMFLCIIFAFLNIIINVSEAYFVKKLIDTALNDGVKKINNLIIGMICIVLLGFIVVYTVKYLYGYFSANVLRDLRYSLIKHIQKLPMSYIDSHHSGDLMSRLTSDISKTQNYVENDFLNIFLQMLLLIASSIYMLTINWKLYVISLIFTPPCLIILVKMYKPIRSYSSKAQEYHGSAISVVQDNVSGIDISKAFNMQTFLNNKYNTSINNALGMQIKSLKIGIWTSPVLVTLKLVPFIICVVYGAYLSINNQITPGELVLFMFLLDFVAHPLAAIPNLLANTKKAMGATERLFEILDEPIERENGQEINIDENYPVISFENVNFSYNENEDVLNNLSFNVLKGKTIALVGSSGSGKSTILKLLCGFYELQSGDIKLWGNSQEKWNLIDYRSKMSYVSQDTFLFPTTIYENISYGKENATYEEVIEASKIAHTHDFIMELPDGYNTLVGEKGVNLSGGQKQRISLARAILKNAEILLLDEPTSALDTQSEAKVQEELNTIMKDKTVLVIAHRLSTIKNADEILVIDNGKMVEKGSHNELIEKNGVYKQLYLKQFDNKEGGKDYD